MSTNSITQGEQAALLWQPLFSAGIRIHFGYRTFRWDSEASEKAHVHCVIVGFADRAPAKPFLFKEDGMREAKITATAQAILDARATYPDCSLAELYGERMVLFPELKSAHAANDRAVLSAYGFPAGADEASVAAELMRRYQRAGA